MATVAKLKLKYPILSQSVSSRFVAVSMLLQACQGDVYHSYNTLTIVTEYRNTGRHCANKPSNTNYKPRFAEETGLAMQLHIDMSLTQKVPAIRYLSCTSADIKDVIPVMYKLVCS